MKLIFLKRLFYKKKTFIFVWGSHLIMLKLPSGFELRNCSRLCSGNNMGGLGVNLGQVECKTNALVAVLLLTPQKQYF